MDALPNQNPQYATRTGGGGGGCCCGMGCLSIIVIMAVALALFIGGLWYLYVKSIDALTADAPVAVLMETPSEAQFAAASTEGGAAPHRRADANRR